LASRALRSEDKIALFGREDTAAFIVRAPNKVAMVFNLLTHPISNTLFAHEMTACFATQQ
jgi:hypothetical protein